MGRGRKNYELLKRQGQVGNRKCHMERSRSFRGRFITRHKNSLKNVLFLTNSNILLLDCTRPQLAGTKGSISQSPKTAVANAKREITQKNEGAVAGVDNVRR